MGAASVKAVAEGQPADRRRQQRRRQAAGEADGGGQAQGQAGDVRTRHQDCSLVVSFRRRGAARTSDG